MSLGKYQGNLSADREEAYGRLFANYLRDPENFFIISSDFCHWGQRFGYTYHDTSVGEIYQVIGPKFSFHILIFLALGSARFGLSFSFGLLRGSSKAILLLTTEFNPQPSTLNPQPSTTLNPQPSTLNPKPPSTLNPKP
jgi:hypothetical protein